MMPNKLVYLTERQVKLGITKLFNKITASGEKFTKVVGIERGGLHISVPLADRLKVPHCSIKISFYPNENQHSPECEPNVDTHGVQFDANDYLLFVDDLVDSGSTLRYFKQKFPYNHKAATLLWNPLAFYNVAPDYFVKHKINSWIVFPWDKKQEAKQ
jgi:hypoxanthine phosphoribosyltransferase